jgi:hypothetical protein
MTTHLQLSKLLHPRSTMFACCFEHCWGTENCGLSFLSLFVVLSQLQATCADVNLDVPDKQPFQCAEGNLPNPAAVNATSPTNRVCCLVSSAVPAPRVRILRNEMLQHSCCQTLCACCGGCRSSAQFQHWCARTCSRAVDLGSDGHMCTALCWLYSLHCSPLAQTGMCGCQASSPGPALVEASPTLPVHSSAHPVTNDGEQHSQAIVWPNSNMPLPLWLEHCSAPPRPVNK